MREREARISQEALDRLAEVPRLVFGTASGAVSVLCLIGLLRLL